MLIRLLRNCSKQVKADLIADSSAYPLTQSVQDDLRYISNSKLKGQSTIIGDHSNRKKGQGWMRKDWKKINKQYVDAYKVDKIDADQLRINKIYFSIQKYVQQFIKREDAIRPTPIIYSRLLYNSVKNGHGHQRFFFKLEPYLPKYQQNFPSYMAYGSLIGCLLFNYKSKKFANFMKKRIPKKLQLNDALQLLHAAALNSIMSLDWRQRLVMPYISLNLKKIKRIHHQNLGTYFDDLNQLQIWDQVYWQSHLQKFLVPGVKGALRFLKWRKYKILTQQFKNQCIQYLQNDQDVLWRFNLKQGRLYTNQQMIQKSQFNLKPIKLNSFFSQQEAQLLHKIHKLNIQQGDKASKQQEMQQNASKMVKMLQKQFVKSSSKHGDVSKTITDQQLLKIIGITQEQFQNMSDDSQQNLNNKIKAVGQNSQLRKRLMQLIKTQNGVQKDQPQIQQNQVQDKSN